jgi:hypothetical protein
MRRASTFSTVYRPGTGRYRSWAVLRSPSLWLRVGASFWTCLSRSVQAWISLTFSVTECPTALRVQRRSSESYAPNVVVVVHAAPIGVKITEVLRARGNGMSGCREPNGAMAGPGALRNFRRASISPARGIRFAKGKLRGSAFGRFSVEHAPWFADLSPERDARVQTGPILARPRMEKESA